MWQSCWENALLKILGYLKTPFFFIHANNLSFLIYYFEILSFLQFKLVYLVVFQHHHLEYHHCLLKYISLLHAQPKQKMFQYLNLSPQIQVNKVFLSFKSRESYLGHSLSEKVSFTFCLQFQFTLSCVLYQQLKMTLSFLGCLENLFSMT